LTSLSFSLSVTHTTSSPSFSLRPGDILVVSGAAGAVGSLVTQFGKLAGCKVYGIAGSAEKCEYLLNTLHLDGAINYKDFNHNSSLLSAHLLELTGSVGVDIYFDNVGGWITDAIIPIIRLRARIIICGQITQYEGKLDTPELGPRFLHHLLFQRATIQGILARDFTHRMPELLQVLSPLVREKKIVFEETVLEGFECLPEALNLLFEGKNLGKLIVKV
jgi:NADPH-dependent curcumin reductase CurA